jgi:ribonucleoside-diphosphate reductase alpha chain
MTGESWQPPPPIEAAVVGWPGPRRPLPDERPSITHAFDILAVPPGGFEPIKSKFYLNVGLYENGQPGELFVTIRNDQGMIRGLLDAMATMASIALQHGAPLDSICSKLTGHQFYPGGMTSNPDIPRCGSPLDYIGRYLLLRFPPPKKADHA